MDVGRIRGDFPTIRGGRGIYLDSACQSLRPDSVIRAVTEYYEGYPACGGRSVHSMATRVSVAMDETREALARFFGTDDPGCYAFTKNCTEGLNTAAYGLGLRRGDVVVTTDTEHNSNHVPWLRLQETVGIRRRMSRSGPDGRFDMESFMRCMDRDVKVVAVQQASNVTGCTVPVRAVAEVAHDCGATVVIDGAQAAPHMPVDLEKIGADVYCASIHKMLGPSGMGFMYGRREVLERVRPMSLGGGTVGLATYDSVNLAPVPERFEAGLHDYAGIVGTKAALDYLSGVGMDEVERWDRLLMERIFSGLEDVRGLHVVGPDDPAGRGGVFSFNIDGLESHDIGMMLDSMAGVMIRSGMHCAHPFYVSRGINGSARASTYLYNTPEEIDVFTNAVRHIAKTFGDASFRQGHSRVAGELETFPAVPRGGLRLGSLAFHGHDAAGHGYRLDSARNQFGPGEGDLVGDRVDEPVQDVRDGPGQLLGHLRFGLVLGQPDVSHDGGQKHDPAGAQYGPGDRELDHAATEIPHSPFSVTHVSLTDAFPDTDVAPPRTGTAGCSMYTRPTSSPSDISLMTYASPPSPPSSREPPAGRETSTVTEYPSPP